jgi:uncharacterized membrane protein (DUF2068 family)
MGLQDEDSALESTDLELCTARPYRLAGNGLLKMNAPSHKTLALRSVAIFEAAKGLMVLFLGLGLLRLVHKNLDAFAEQLIRFLHVAPGGRLSNLFVTAAGKTTDKHLWVLALAAMVYAIVRFAEAFGLWYDREWAEWFALLSGSMYLPWEVYSLMRHPHVIKWVVLSVNVAIVAYMLVLRVQAGAAKTRVRRTA